MSALPVVTRVPHSLDAIGCRRYRIEGGEIAQDWREACERRGKQPWCEVTTWGDHPTQLSSYGGEVWPSAWPKLFEPHRGTAQTGPFTLLRAAAVELFEAADAACTEAR